MNCFRNSPSSIERLNKISLQRAYEIYKERFANASGFTFIFVGNFDVATITPLLEQYLGALPSQHKNEQARDLGIHIPAGLITKKYTRELKIKLSCVWLSGAITSLARLIMYR